LDRRLSGPQSQSGCGGEEKNSQPLPGLETRGNKRRKKEDKCHLQITSAYDRHVDITDVGKLNGKSTKMERPLASGFSYQV
jgi:hypothetical protein